MNGEYIQTHDSIRDAARSIRFDKHVVENIRQNCYGMKKSAYGYVWKFSKEVLQNA